MENTIIYTNIIVIILMFIIFYMAYKLRELQTIFISLVGLTNLTNASCNIYLYHRGAYTKREFLNLIINNPSLQSELKAQLIAIAGFNKADVESLIPDELLDMVDFYADKLKTG